MEVPKRKIDLFSVQSATHYRKDQADRLTRKVIEYLADVRITERHQESQCKYCFYIAERMGGAAITTTECANCPEQLTFGNTSIDILCRKCGDKLRLCVHCGGDREMLMRRKLEKE